MLDTGHIDPVDLKVSLDYDVARAILIEGNPQAGIQAFMSGKIKVEGDIAKLMALQSHEPRSERRRRSPPGSWPSPSSRRHGSVDRLCRCPWGSARPARYRGPAVFAHEEPGHPGQHGHHRPDRVGAVERGQ